MDLSSIVLAPIRVPLRVAQALDDLATLAERARRDPDPVEEVRDRVDLLNAQLAALNAIAPPALAEIEALRHLATDLLDRVQVLLATANSIIRTGQSLDVTGRDLIAGGEDLTVTSKAIERDTRELIEGGEDLTAVSERLAADLHVFRAALPRLLEGLDTVEELEGAVETVAETVEPLQGAAERVGRVTRRLSRSPA